MGNGAKHKCVTGTVTVHCDSSHPALLRDLLQRRLYCCWWFSCKAHVCGHSTAGTLGSNPSDCTDVSVFWVLSGRGICDELITRPEESHRLWCVVVCDLQSSRMRYSWPPLGRSATRNKLWLDIDRARENQSLIILLLFIEWRYWTRIPLLLLSQEIVIVLLP